MPVDLLPKTQTAFPVSWWCNDGLFKMGDDARAFSLVVTYFFLKLRDVVVSHWSGSAIGWVAPQEAGFTGLAGLAGLGKAPPSPRGPWHGNKKRRLILSSKRPTCRFYATWWNSMNLPLVAIYLPIGWNPHPEPLMYIQRNPLSHVDDTYPLSLLLLWHSYKVLILASDLQYSSTALTHNYLD